jgi:hypothetical protein
LCPDRLDRRPAGHAAKTTLAASYLDAHELVALWYLVEASRRGTRDTGGWVADRKLLETSLPPFGSP